MVDVNITGGFLPPDIHYYLDGSIDCFDITPDVYIWGKFFEPNFTQILDSLGEEEIQADNHSERLNTYGQRLEQAFLKWQETADPASTAVCLAYGAAYSTDVESIVDGIVGQIVDYNDPTMPSLRGIVEVTHETKDLIYYNGLKYIERKLSYFRSRKRMLDQWAKIKDTIDWNSIEIKWPAPKKIKFKIDDEEEFIDLGSPAKKVKLFKREQKKALKRSAELLNNITGENTVSLFLSGQEVVVTGEKYKFVLTKQQYGDIAGSHGSANTRVFHRETGEFVCGLCVYTEKVTVFDHLASLVLHCKAGLEEQIISDANITSRGNIQLLPDAKRNEVLDTSNRFDRMFRSTPEESQAEKEARKKAVRESVKLKQKIVKRFKKKYPELSLKATSRVIGLDDLLFQQSNQPLMITG